MNDWILQLTGNTVEAGSEIIGSQLKFHGNVEWGWVAEVGWLIKSIHGEIMKGWPNDGTALWEVLS